MRAAVTYALALLSLGLLYFALQRASPGFLLGTLLALFASQALADAEFVAVEQRNTTDTGWITRQLPNPALGADGIMFFNGATRLPGYVVLGAGLTISSGVLASNVPGNVNADWNASSGGAQILNKPSLAAVATSGAYSDLTGRPAIPAAQVNADWAAGSGVAQVLNKPALAPVATSGSYADLTGRPSIPAAQVNTDWNATGGLPQLLNKPLLAAVATSGAYADLSGKPSIPSGDFGAPAARTVALATAYQCSAPARPCSVTLTLQSQSSISLSGASNNEGAVTLGSTSAVASGTGTNVATYKNNLGGALVVGLNLTSQQANTYTVSVPAGWYFAVRQTAGTGLQVVSAFDQPVN